MENSNVTLLKDKRRKNWFWETNDIFGSNLSAHGKLVRLYLARCANSDRRAWPSYNRIAKDCGISRDTAKRAVAELEEKGWIEKSNQVKENGEYSSNIYFLCDPPEPEEEPQEKQQKDEEKSQDESDHGGGCSQHPPLRALEGGGCREHLPPRNYDRVGAHSTQVGADSTLNNTHRTIPIKQETYNHSSNHHHDDDKHATEPADKFGPVDNRTSSNDEIAIESLLRYAGFEGLQMEVDFLTPWLDLFPLDMIHYAVTKSVLNGKKSLPYIAGIFVIWQKKGIRTLAQAEKESRYDSVPSNV